MSYDQKIDAVKKIIDSHNSNVEKECQIDFQSFVNKLSKLGGTSEEALFAVSWEDLESCGLPRIIARRATYVFRKDENSSKDEKSIWVSDKKAYSMSLKELLDRYEPKESDSNIFKRLLSLSKGQNCIVFDNNGKVLVDESEKLLKDIKDGLPSLNTVILDGRPVITYKVGDCPEQYWDENPLFPGRILRSNQICDQTNRSWDGVSNTIRQLLWIAVSTKELKIDGASKAHDILDKLISGEWDEKAIRTRFQNSSIKFDELSKINQTPILKVKINKTQSKVQNPFSENVTY